MVAQSNKMNKKMKKRKIRISRVLPILVAIIIFYVIFNYIVIPPKVSKNAKKYSYNSFNILKLKSITVDNDRIIYEFSSLNLFFNGLYVKINQKYNDEDYLRGYFNEIDKETKQYDLTDYKIISTLTSNCLIISLQDEIEISSVRCSYKKGKSGEQLYIIVAGMDNPKLHKLSGLDETIIYEQQSQYFDINKGKWNKPQKKEFDKNIKAFSK